MLVTPIYGVCMTLAPPLLLLPQTVAPLLLLLPQTVAPLLLLLFLLLVAPLLLLFLDPHNGSVAPISRCSGTPLKTQTKRKTTTKLPPRKQNKLSEDDPWVPELNLTLKEKLVLESPDGMLTDKHMDAANRLLRSQFPHLQGLQSSLISQSRNGFNPVEVSDECMPKGM